MPSSPFRIDWNTHTTRQWDRMLLACRRSTLPQTWQYAAAKAGTTGEVADNGIIHFHDKPVGLVQVQRRRFLGPIAACSLYRGPLWVYDTIPGHMQKIVLRLLRQRYAAYRGKTFIFHPELEDSPDHRDQLKNSGFVRTADGYSTTWVDLRQELQELRSGLRQKWRNSLHQAERSGLAVETDASCQHLDWLLERHTADMAERQYVGPSAALIRKLHKLGQPVGMTQILRARRDGKTVAGILVARHGKTATYLVGWTSEEGRSSRAHHLLMWQALEHLKAAGASWFDLGGHNDKDAAGIARFKAGLSGRPVTLVGTYR